MEHPLGYMLDWVGNAHTEEISFQMPDLYILLCMEVVFSLRLKEIEIEAILGDAFS